jgi:hypothetical protein
MKYSTISIFKSYFARSLSRSLPRSQKSAQQLPERICGTQVSQKWLFALWEARDLYSRIFVKYILFTLFVVQKAPSQRKTCFEGHFLTFAKRRNRFNSIPEFLWNRKTASPSFWSIPEILWNTWRTFWSILEPFHSLSRSLEVYSRFLVK